MIIPGTTDEDIDNSASSWTQNGKPYNQTAGGLRYDPNNADSMFNAVNQQALWDREDLLRANAEKREDYAMDRVITAAKRNGINPIFLMDALSSNTVGNAASYTTSAYKASNYDSNARTEQANSAKWVSALISALGIIIGAAIAA